ncbi:hypothetical protein Tco_0915975, partial [Tanacetum coccineum]
MNQPLRNSRKKVVHLAQVLADKKDSPSVMNDIPYASTSAQQECTVKLEPPYDTPKMETFSEKVKKLIMETQANEEKLLKKLESELVNTTVTPRKFP